MIGARRDRARPGRWTSAGLLGLLLPLLVSAGGAATPARAAPAGPTVEITPTTVTEDGQAVKVTVRAPADVRVGGAQIKQCRAGVDYQSSSTNAPAPDFNQNGENCPLEALSSSADPRVGFGTLAIERTSSPEGVSVLFRVGKGVVKWTPTEPPGQGEKTLECGVGHPCALVAEILWKGVSDLSPGSGRWTPFVAVLTFQDNDPFAGCGGPADGVLATGGSDRMSDAWIAWTVSECKAPGRQGIAGRSSFVGEGEAVRTFATGTLDLAYTAGGYDEAMRLVRPADPVQGAPRAAVAVPVALNAAVLAVGGGAIADGNLTPYRDLKLEVDEVAALMNQGSAGFEPYLTDILARNAELSPGNVFSNVAGFQVGAVADITASSWYMTRWLTETASAEAWTVPDAALYGVDRKKKRVVDASLALSDPSYSRSLELFNGSPALRKGLILGSKGGGGVWVFTDLASAKSLGLTPVQIENASGQFVAPTPETLAAAVPAMVRDAGGILISDPKAVAPAGQVQPYPLAFVEYALAPAQPLVDESACTTRDKSQALLDGWMKYVTGPGQTSLTAGLAPLTDGLKTDAAAAIGKVGASTVTGPCEGRVNPSATPPTTAAETPAPAAAPAPASAESQAESSSRSSSSTRSGSTASKPSSSPPVATPTTPTAQIENVSAVDLPAYAGKAATAFGGALVALVGIMALGSLSGVSAHRREPAPWPPLQDAVGQPEPDTSREPLDPG